MMAKYAWLDQGNYVSHAAPAVVFLQYARQERFLTPERARQYAAFVSEPKIFKLYDAPTRSTPMPGGIGSPFSSSS